MTTALRLRTAAAAAVLLAMLVVPAPLLPPHRLAEAVRSATGIGWKGAYLVAALGLQFGFWAALGLLASLAVRRAPTTKGRLLQFLFVPTGLVALAFAIRSAKLGHLPAPANLLVPVGACLLGATLGLAFLFRGAKVAVPLAAAILGATLWGFLGGVSAELGRTTAAHLDRLVAAGPSLPNGDERFAALVRAAFAPAPAGAPQVDAVHHNRAAILALGIAVGHERLASLAGIEREGGRVAAAAALRPGVSLRGREDWARHFLLSAALAIVENPRASDAGGLVKEELDALARGSGFSFGDLAADRAGVRFAVAATASDAAAKAMQARLWGAFAVDDLFPPAADLPEDLTVEQFRADYDGVGSAAFRRKVAEIDARLDRCAALVPPFGER